MKELDHEWREARIYLDCCPPQLQSLATDLQPLAASESNSQGEHFGVCAAGDAVTAGMLGPAVSCGRESRRLNGQNWIEDEEFLLLEPSPTKVG